MTERVTLEICGLGCGGSGALTIERRLARLAGVVRAYVNPATEAAFVIYDPAQISPADLSREIAELGFRAGELVRHPM